MEKITYRQITFETRLVDVDKRRRGVTVNVQLKRKIIWFSVGSDFQTKEITESSFAEYLKALVKPSVDYALSAEYRGDVPLVSVRYSRDHFDGFMLGHHTKR